MNVVGPRPEQPAIFARLRAEIAAYPQRQRVRPGITGWAQVNQSYDSCVEDVRRKLAFDLEYIRRESVGEDLRIMLRTVPVMVLRLGPRGPPPPPPPRPGGGGRPPRPTRRAPRRGAAP